MAHWAEIDENNIVLRVTVGNNEEPDEGYQWLIDNLGGTWIQTSYNGNIRKNFAGIGFVYDEARDAFIPPKPEPDDEVAEWVLNEDTCLWDAPVPKPEGDYTWDEQTGNWVEVTNETE